jgi:hypothetical protein
MSFAVVALLTACTSLPMTEPRLSYRPGPWYEAERERMTVEWPAAQACENGAWSCTYGDVPQVQVTAVTCDGCRAFDVPSNRIYSGRADFDFEATTTDAITLTVGVEADGEHRTLTAHGLGDRELALHARCTVAITSVLDGTSSSNQDFYDCRPTRLPSETVVVELMIETLRGHERFPFCPDDLTCSLGNQRRTSTISVTPAPDRWAFSYPAFSGPDGATVTIGVPLDTGEISSATVVIPPVASP